MDYGAGAVCLVLGIVVCLAQVMEAQSGFHIPCPPPFPDFEAIFARTLRLNNKFRDVKLHLQSQLNRPPNCSCSPELMSNIGHFNERRCERTSSVARVCPRKSTTSQAGGWPTRPTLSVPEFPSHSPIPPAPTTVTYSTGGGWGGPTSSSTLDKQKSSSRGGVNVIDLDHTTTTPLSSPTDGLPTAKPVSSRDDEFTIIVIAIGAGVLLLIFLIGCLLLCRKRLCAGNGVQDARPIHEKQRQSRSDSLPTSATNPGGTCDGSYAPSMISSVGSIGSEGYRSGYVTNGRKWRPDFDSETGSDKSAANAKYILLREDSSASALSFSHHYNTLHTLESPHASMMGGFGESSTDMTIPRKTKRKKHGITANGDVSLDSIEDPMEVMPNSNAMRRKHSKDSLNSIEIYGRVSKARSLVTINGYANGGNAQLPSARQWDRGEESDNCSLDTIDQTDDEDEAVLDVGAPTDTGVMPREQSVTMTVRRGIINLSFQPEDPTDTVDENWQNKVIDELKKNSAATQPVNAEDECYDSLHSKKNSHLFGYQNKITDSPDTQLDPPSDFRDSKDSEISVAVVLPLNSENARFPNKFLNRDSNPQVFGSSVPAHKQPPPVARKPQNGSVKYALVKQASGDVGFLPHTEATARKDSDMTKPATPIANGHVANGEVHQMNGIDVEAGKGMGLVKKLIQQREIGMKPSAHVQPTRYGDTRL